MTHGKKRVLDHGYLEFIEGWGSDERIIEAARMSTGKGFLGWEPGPCPTCGGLGDDNVLYQNNKCNDCEGKGHIRGDKFLLATLYNSSPKHTTPFEMAGMVVEVMAPIMVYREWHRHRTQSYNEMSGRYVPLPDVNYVPSVGRMLVNSKTNKQAGVIKGADELDEETAERLRQKEVEFNKAAEEFYQEKLEAGVPKELARTHIGVSRYSRMRASTNLLNWLKFLTLRMDSKAQWEIRQYANAVGELIADRFPRTWTLFDQSRSKQT